MTLRRCLASCYSSLALALPYIILPVALCQIQPVSENLPAPHQPNAIPHTPVSPEVEGDLLSARQRYLSAIEAYRRAPQDSAVVANKMGVAYHHMFDIVDAKLNYERALKLNPHYAEAMNNLGAIYHAEKNYKQAQKYYRKAIKQNPNSPLFYSNLGTSYFFQGNAKKGAEAYRQAFALDPQVFERGNSAKIEQSSTTKDMATVNYCLAKTYAKAGNNERAMLYLRRAIGEGFSDRKSLMNDRELASVRVTPEFAQLLSRERIQ